MKSLRQKTGRRATRAHAGLAPLGGRPVPQPAPDPSGPERSGMRRCRASASFSAAASGACRKNPCRRSTRSRPGPDRLAAGCARPGSVTPRCSLNWRACACSPTRSGARAHRPPASPARKRFQPVPVRLRAMPPLDLVVVTHDHYDHLDYPTIRKLAARDVPLRDVARRRRAPRSLGRRSLRASPSSTGGKRTGCRTARSP